MKKRVLSIIWTLAIMMSVLPVTLASTWEPPVVKPNPPDGEIITIVGSVLGVIQWIGFIVAIAMIIYVGIKYLTAGAGDKAKVKDTLIPMLIGAILVALGPTIVAAVFNTLAPQPGANG